MLKSLNTIKARHFLDLSDEWLSKGVLQRLIDKEEGILPSENEKLEILFNADSELLVLWLEKYIMLEKKHRATRDELLSKDRLPDHEKHMDSDDELSKDIDRDSEISKDYDGSGENGPSLNDFYQFGQKRLLAARLKEYHPVMSEAALNVIIAEARVGNEFKRIKTAIE